MPQQTDLEKDPFLVLLSDALRAGPGSPEWREAVAKLKTGGGDVDEYRLLIEAREALESGKDYRSVRAGAGFTRKLMTNLDEERPARSRRPFPLAGLIAALAAVAILGLAGWLAYKLYPRNPLTPGTRTQLQELRETYFPNAVLSATFENGIPPGWRTIGGLPVLAVAGGLRAAEAVVPDRGYLGGGIVATDPMPAAQPFSVLVTIDLKAPSDGLIPQVFVSNSSEFSPDHATAPQELVWQVQGNEEKVVVGGRVEKQSPLPGHAQTVSVRLILNRDLAIIESDGHPLWSGSNGLGDQPRYVGVRFVRTGGKPAAGDVAVRSVEVKKS